jgi:ABC-type phosphate/phosphonate transport system substrate-binding protein
MKILFALSGALIAMIGAWCSAPAAAQNQPLGSVMIMPGVYTTPEISKKCQKYAAQRVGLGGYTDSSRQAVAAACVRKLMAKENKRAKT